MTRPAAPLLGPLVVLATFLAACTGAATRVPAATPSGGVSATGIAGSGIAITPLPSGGVSPGPASTPGPIADPALREALLVRFGDLVYCDPDVYPIARADPLTAARDHVAAMRADAAAWTIIAGRFAFDASTTPTGDVLLAAYRNWKMLRALQLAPATDGQSFDAVFAPGAGQGAGAGTSAGTSSAGAASATLTHVTGTIRADGSIVVATEEPGTTPNCPICLARGTRISTPTGDVAVEAVRPGDLVWTLSADGRRVPASVARVGSTPVPPTHVVVRLVLADGRAVLVSPGHPLANGQPVGSVVPGDVLDGAIVVSADRVPYDGGRTFDLLPGGDTGTYWANGILLASTLR
jgi:hypothetical protein